MMGEWGYGDIAHPPQAFWEDAEHEHGGAVFSLEYEKFQKNNKKILQKHHQYFIIKSQTDNQTKTNQF